MQGSRYFIQNVVVVGAPFCDDWISFSCGILPPGLQKDHKVFLRALLAGKILLLSQCENLINILDSIYKKEIIQIAAATVFKLALFFRWKWSAVILFQTCCFTYILRGYLLAYFLDVYRLSLQRDFTLQFPNRRFWNCIWAEWCVYNPWYFKLNIGLENYSKITF